MLRYRAPDVRDARPASPLLNVQRSVLYTYPTSRLQSEGSPRPGIGRFAAEGLNADLFRNVSIG